MPRAACTTVAALGNEDLITFVVSGQSGVLQILGGHTGTPRSLCRVGGSLDRNSSWI